MVYQYELILDGEVVRRKTSEFRPNIIALMVEDIPKLHRDYATFEMKVKKLKSWREQEQEIDNGGK